MYEDYRTVCILSDGIVSFAGAFLAMLPIKYLLDQLAFRRNWDPSNSISVLSMECFRCSREYCFLPESPMIGDSLLIINLLWASLRKRTKNTLLRLIYAKYPSCSFHINYCLSYRILQPLPSAQSDQDANLGPGLVGLRKNPPTELVQCGLWYYSDAINQSLAKFPIYWLPSGNLQVYIFISNGIPCEPRLHRPSLWQGYLSR